VITGLALLLAVLLFLTLIQLGRIWLDWVGVSDRRRGMVFVVRGILVVACILITCFIFAFAG